MNDNDINEIILNDEDTNSNASVEMIEIYELDTEDNDSSSDNDRSEVDEGINKELLAAVRDGGVYAEVAGCISRGAAPGWTDGAGYSALHGAADHGHVEVARLLLDRGWDRHLLARDKLGMTPLHYAADFGRPEMIQLLAERAGIAGEGGGHRAARDGRVNKEVVRLRARDKAAIFGRANMELVRAAAARRPFLDCQDDQGKETPLHWASRQGRSDAVRKLLRLGADKSIKRSDGKTARDIAKYPETSSAFD